MADTLVTYTIYLNQQRPVPKLQIADLKLEVYFYQKFKTFNNG